MAAVLYVFRTLVADDIPLNDGLPEAAQLVIPAGIACSPGRPAAVVAGNTEMSQAITGALYSALWGRSPGSQGTMNNFTFGDAHQQYYENDCGGTGAGPGSTAPLRCRRT